MKTVEQWQKELKENPPKGWPCPYCGAPFNTHQGRNNHVRYIHPTEPLPKMSPEEALARKRILNQKWKEKHGDRYRQYKESLKARYRAEGRNAHGDPLRRIQPIVYHAKKETSNNTTIHYCPNCGHGLDKYL